MRGQGGNRLTYLLTLTAPSGQEHQRYVPGRRGRHGLCRTCLPHSALDVWNARAAQHWNRLRTALAREIDGFDYFRAVEVQEGSRGGIGRGALHLHVLISSRTPLDISRLHELATAAGFGCVIDLEPLVPGSRKAARYVSKYVTKACDSRDLVPWVRDLVDVETGEITESRTPTYRTWSSSRDWGCRMRDLVDASRRQVQARDDVRSRPEAPPADDVVPVSTA